MWRTRGPPEPGQLEGLRESIELNLEELPCDLSECAHAYELCTI